MTSLASQIEPPPVGQPYRPSWRFLWALFALALLPRVAGVLWGGIHADENINASVKLLAGQWIPDAHYYPPLSNVLNAVAFVGMFVVGRLIGVWHSLADFRAQYFADPTPFQMTGRLVCATLGAAAAPLTALLASRLGARRWGAAAAAALLVAFLPVNVLLSHISKSADVGMATSFVLVALCFVDFTREPQRWKRAAALGVATALAVSFKHSAVFFVAPVFFAALGLVAFDGRRTPGTVLRAGLIVGSTAAALWLVLNVPILADLRDFLAFQKVQSQMSSRPGGALDIVKMTAPFIAGTFTGATIAIAIAFLALPALRRDKPVLLLWACAILGLLIVMKLTGLRPTIGLYLPYVTLMASLVGVALATWMSNGRPPARVAATLGWAACLAAAGFGTLRVVSQAMRAPAILEVARVVRQVAPPDAKIMSTRLEHAGVPVNLAAKRDERARHERLAAKYNVKLPPVAKEREAEVPGAYHVRRIPWAIGGLEVYDEKQVTAITPFAWPIQDGEYDLDYWTRQGFTVFVLTDEQSRLASNVAAYKRLYGQICERCDLVKEVKARKPLFWEGDTRIYRLKTAAPAAQTRPSTP